MKKVLTFAVWALLCGNTMLLTAQTHLNNKIDPSLSGNTFVQDAIVILQSQADLTPAKYAATKAEKGELVFTALRQTAAATQKDLLRYLQQQQLAYQSFYIVNAVQVKGINPTQLRSLAARSDVRYIQANPRMQLQTPFVNNHAPTAIERNPLLTEWGIRNIKADSVWAMGYTGQQIVIGGADTGYDWVHPTLKGQYRGYDGVNDTVEHAYNWHDAVHTYSPLNADTLNPCGINLTAPCDDHSHGTHTMGTMVGTDDAGNEIGVAPGAKFICCRNMERGWGQPSTYTECFEWFLAPTDLSGNNPDPAKAPHVINNSWYCAVGEGCDNPTPINIMEMAVNNLRTAGVVVVVSNGNFGPGCESTTGPPAYFANSFSVGATDIMDTIAGFSSRGMATTTTGERIIKPNVSAPGVDIRSSIPNGQFANYSGTSMAGPHVAGAIALLLSANPQLIGQVDTVEAIMERTARPITTAEACSGVPGSQIPNNTFGYGIINVLDAVRLGQTFTSTAHYGATQPPLKVYPNPSTAEVTFELPIVSARATLTLYDGIGKNVANYVGGHSARLQYSLQHLPKGIYYYQLQTDTARYNGKLIKQ